MNIYMLFVCFPIPARRAAGIQAGNIERYMPHMRRGYYVNISDSMRGAYANTTNYQTIFIAYTGGKDYTMSNKSLLKNIANNSVSTPAFNAISGYIDAVDTMTNNARARAAAMSAWKIAHNYDDIRRAAMRKNATDAQKLEYERVKNARADYAAIIARDTNEKNAPARAAQSDALVTIYSRGGKNDNSKRAAAFRHFYKSYAAYRMEYSANANTPAGKKAVSALVNLYNVCFGFTFAGGVANDVARRTLNVLGVRIANNAENMKGARGVSVFNESQVKRLLICIAASMLNSGKVDNFNTDSIIVTDDIRADYAAAMRD